MKRCAPLRVERSCYRYRPCALIVADIGITAQLSQV